MYEEAFRELHDVGEVLLLLLLLLLLMVMVMMMRVVRVMRVMRVMMHRTTRVVFRCLVVVKIEVQST